MVENSLVWSLAHRFMQTARWFSAPGAEENMSMDRSTWDTRPDSPRAAGAGVFSVGAAARPGLTFLVVHPAPIVRSTLAVTVGMSTPRTVRVLEAGSVSEAVSLLKFNLIDVAFCALDLPEAPGAEALGALAPYLDRVQLVLMPGDGEDGLAEAMSHAEERKLRVLGSLGVPISRADVKRLLEQDRLDTPRRYLAAISGPTARELDEAIAERQVVVHYQPTVALGSRRPLSLEALARWNSPVHGLLDARHFIPLAERAGLMPALTLLVARQSFAELAAWHRQGLALSLVLNVSTSGINDMDLPDLLARCAESVGVSPHWVVLEFSELQLGSFTNVYGVLARLRSFGFRLAIDNFGIGRDSADLGLLRRLYFSEFKIDRSLVTGAAGYPERRSNLAHLIDLGRRLDMRVTAGGVETNLDWNLLAAMGCHAAQGHLISQPLPASGVPAWKNMWMDPQLDKAAV